MAPLKCVVNGCDSTSATQKLFCMPMIDNLRSLWMSFLVPVNPSLLGLTKSQLVSKRVCKRHFDETQFDSQGVRIRYSYPCLFTEKEIFHGVPLSSEEYNVLSEHNYCSNQEQEDNNAQQDPMVLMSMADDVHLQDHLYTVPITNQPASSFELNVESGQQQLVQPTTTNTSSTGSFDPASKGSSVSQEPLIVDTPNVESDRSKTRHSSSTKGVTVTTLRKKKIAQNDNMGNIQIHTSTAKARIKQFKAQTRRLIKETTKVAVGTLGQASKERLINAQEFANPQLMQELENLNKKAKAFLLMQLRLARRNKMARRFSLQDKLFALGLMKQSPKGYKFLQNIFALPTKRTLARLSSKVIFETGINEGTFNYIKQNVDLGRKKKIVLISIR